MSNDDLVAVDVENAILTGKIEKRFPGIREGRAMKSSAKRVIIDPSRLYAELDETVGS